MMAACAVKMRLSRNDGEHVFGVQDNKFRSGCGERPDWDRGGCYALGTWRAAWPLLVADRTGASTKRLLQ